MQFKGSFDHCRIYKVRLSLENAAGYVEYNEMAPIMAKFPGIVSVYYLNQVRLPLNHTGGLLQIGGESVWHCWNTA